VGLGVRVRGVGEVDLVGRCLLFPALS